MSSVGQNEKLQEKDCLAFAESKKMNVIRIFSEVASAGKSKQKQIYEAEKLAIKVKADIIVWKYDRSFRNKKDFANFMLKMYELHNIKIYSVQEQWVNMLWEVGENIDYDKIPYPFNEKLREDMKSNWKLMIKIIGKSAEDEIRDKGARVKLAVVKTEGKPTKSYKGNKWGRKSLSKQTINKVIELHKQGKSMREIANEVVYYDSQRNERQISKSAVHKIVTTHNN